MSDLNLVSVVIVCHNNWPDLELAIASALQQSYRPIEVIVVDNESSDATPQEVRKCFGDSVHYIRQCNVGDGGGYNTGMRIARGEFVQFFDGDDFLAPNKIEKQIKVLRTDPTVDIVYGDVRNFQSFAGFPDWMDGDTGQCEDILTALVLPDRCNAGLTTHGMLFRRRTLERVGEWDEHLYITDYDYWLRAAFAGCKFRYCPGSLCFHRRRPDQMSANRLEMVRGWEQAWAKGLSYVTSEPYRGMLAARLARHRFYMAVSKIGITANEALAKLRLARETNHNAIPLAAFWVGRILVDMPGGSFLVKTPWLKKVRSPLARLLGLK